MLILTCIFFIVLLTITLLLFREYIQKKLKQKRRETDVESKLVVGFFHPYCNAGGGGERVLWIAIKALQNKYVYKLLQFYDSFFIASYKVFF